MTEELKKEIKKYLDNYDNEFGKPEVDDYYTWNEEAYLLLEKVLKEDIK